MKEEKKVIFDHIQVTFIVDEIEKESNNWYSLKMNNDLSKIFNFFNFIPNIIENEIIPDGNAFYYFKHSIFIKDKIRLLWGKIQNRDNKFIACLIVPGNECKELKNLDEFLSLLESLNGVRFKRIDINYDSFEEKHFTLSDLIEIVKNKNYTSNVWENRIYKTPINNDSFPTYPDSISIYIGAKKYNQLLIYNKKLEQLKKNIVVDKEIWNRYEIRLYEPLAANFVKEYKENNDILNTLFINYLNNIFIPRESKGYEEKIIHERPIWNNWNNFLIDLKKDLKV